MDQNNTDTVPISDQEINNDTRPEINPSQTVPPIQPTIKHPRINRLIIIIISLLVIASSIAGFFILNKVGTNSISQINTKNNSIYKIIGNDLIGTNDSNEESVILSNSKLVSILDYENNKLYLRYLDDNQNDMGRTIFNIGYIDIKSNKPAQIKLSYRAYDYYSGMIYVKDDNIYYASSNRVLFKYDTKNNTKIEISENVEPNSLALDNGLLYYFVYDKNISKSILNSYNIKTNEKTYIETAPCRGVYSMVLYDNILYYGVSGASLTSNGYGVLKYDISTKQTSLFINKDLRSIERGDNFIKLDNYYYYVDNDQLFKTDDNGKTEVVYTLDNKDNYLGEQITLNSKNILRINVGSFKGESYGYSVGYVYLDINDNFKVVENIKPVKSILYI